MSESMNDRFILRTLTDWHAIEEIVTTQSCARETLRRHRTWVLAFSLILGFPWSRWLLIFIFIIRQWNVHDAFSCLFQSPSTPSSYTSINSLWPISKRRKDAGSQLTMRKVKTPMRIMTQLIDAARLLPVFLPLSAELRTHSCHGSDPKIVLIKDKTPNDVKPLAKCSIQEDPVSSSGISLPILDSQNSVL